MNRKELIRRLKLPEWDDLEAKEAGKDLPKDIWKTVSAFSNTNGGVVVLGVKDQGRGNLDITGIENPDKIQSDFISTLRSGKFNIQLSSKGRLFTIDGRRVITFRLPAMPRQAKPVFFNDDIRNTCIRQGATNQKASKDEIGRMLREASEFSSDSMLITGTGIRQINRETLRTYLRYLEIQNQEHPFLALKDIQILEKCAAMKDGTLTMAGLLLFGKKEAIVSRFPAYGLSIFHMSAMSGDMPGERRWGDRKIYEENLVQTFFSAMDYLKRYVAVPFKMSADGVSRTENVPQVIVIREALVNLLIHRDYFDNGQAAIRIYNEGIVFKNPGAAPFPIEEILSGCESVPRNPNIARVFRLPGWAEIAGSGMMKIFDNWRAAGYVSPVIRNNEPTHWFTIEFSEKSLTPEGEVTGSEITTQKRTPEKTKEKAQKRTQKQQSILVYLKEHPEATIRDISLNVEGMTENGVKSIIKTLRKKDLLKHVGPDKSGHWEVLEDFKVRDDFYDQGAITHESTQKTTLEKTKEKTQKCTKKQQAILDYLKGHPSASMKGISLYVEGVTENGVKSIIKVLQRKRLLRRIGPDKGGHWEVVEMYRDQNQGKNIEN
ncbi:MAG: RNA-binding domain-containing protein [Thermodesulfobacteriota bacterium]